jgi:hypothetical protein
MQNINNGRCNGCGKIVLDFAVAGVCYCIRCIRSLDDEEMKVVKRMGSLIGTGMYPSQYIEYIKRNTEEAYSFLASVFETEEEKNNIALRKSAEDSKYRETIANIFYDIIPPEFPYLSSDNNQKYTTSILLNYFTIKLDNIINKVNKTDVDNKYKQSVIGIMLKIKPSLRNQILELFKSSEYIKTYRELMPYLVTIVVECFYHNIEFDCKRIVDNYIINSIDV